jgi:hypothetical protein
VGERWQGAEGGEVPQWGQRAGHQGGRKGERVRIGGCHRYPMGDSVPTHTHTHMKTIPGLMGMGTASYGYGY